MYGLNMPHLSLQLFIEVALLKVRQGALSTVVVQIHGKEQVPECHVTPTTQISTHIKMVVH